MYLYSLLPEDKRPNPPFSSDTLAGPAAWRQSSGLTHPPHLLL